MRTSPKTMAEIRDRVKAAYHSMPVSTMRIAVQLKSGNVIACHTCGASWPVDLMDAKPDNKRKAESCDWTKLECPECYGPNWLCGP